MNCTNVSIVIQARSTSKRFPGKIFERIKGKQVLQYVLDACKNSMSWINSRTQDHGIFCNVALVVPTGDVLIEQFSRALIIQGPEDDVLSRYVMAQKQLRSDYVCRITSDCPLIPPFLISKCINLCVQGQHDFLTNADPIHRTTPDGWDCEVMSARLLDYINANATLKEHREHVTKYLYDGFPQGFSRADVIGFYDMSKEKLSIDTPEDLEHLRATVDKIYQAIQNSDTNYRL